MRRMKRSIVLAVGAAVGCAALTAQPAMAAGHDDKERADNSRYSFAVIGDVPYGSAEIAAFPSYVQDINSHHELSFVAHVGDIKNGSSVCSDDYFAMIRKDFDAFRLPLVYTPGDNEWTDCHRTNNGAYNPLERLAAVRNVFFPRPGVTLGRPMKVDSQADLGLPENVNFSKHGIAVAVVNIPGSDNSMLPWSGLGQTTPTAAQVAEVQNRTKADIAEIRETFAKAKARHDRTVLVMTQADMFDPTVSNPQQSDFGAFKPIVHTLIKEANAFGKPVYLINGDSHIFNEDYPLAAGSSWLSFYGETAPAKNLTRVTVDGSSNAQDWLKVTAARKGSATPLTFERVPFTHPAS